MSSSYIQCLISTEHIQIEANNKSAIKDKERIDGLRASILSKVVEMNPTSISINLDDFQSIVLPQLLRKLEAENFTDDEIKLRIEIARRQLSATALHAR